MGQMINISEEERERRRQNMLRLHQEGRAGAEFGKMGGRPKKPRASEHVAEQVREDAEIFYQRMREIVLEGGEKVASATFNTLMKIEEQERKITVEEEDKIDQLRREELLAFVAEKLGELQSSGIIAVGEAEVVRDEGLAELGEELDGIAEAISPEGSAD